MNAKVDDGVKRVGEGGRCICSLSMICSTVVEKMAVVLWVGRLDCVVLAFRDEPGWIECGPMECSCEVKLFILVCPMLQKVCPRIRSAWNGIRRR